MADLKRSAKLMSSEFKAWEEIGNRTDAVAKDYWRLVADSKDHATELSSVRASIVADGVWKIDEEWRVMTWTSVCIRKTQKEEKAKPKGSGFRF